MQTIKRFLKLQRLAIFSCQRPQGTSRCAPGQMKPHALLLFLFLLFVGVGEACGHEFEDGFVERSVAVVVRDNIARLEYSIGLNPNTRQQLIAFWRSTEISSDKTPSCEAEAKDETENKTAFYQLAAHHLSRRLKILVNNQPAQPKLISALPSARHHVDVTVVLEVVLPTSAPQTAIAIEIVDGNFFSNQKVQGKIAQETLDPYGRPAPAEKMIQNEPQLPPAPFSGGFRYALKAVGANVLISSNVASILIRADRHLDSDFTDAQRKLAFRIKAQVSSILPPPANQSP